jgi:hypothetical protein
VRLRDRLGLPERRQRQLTRVMETGLVGLFLVGLLRGSTTVAINSLLALAVARLPGVLERDYGIPMDAGLTLWITSAVFLHAFGGIGLPWTPLSPYQSLWWYDHLTHGLSASVVAAAGYATARALDVHSADVTFPSEFMVVFIFLFVLAFGVLWEVIEFAASSLSTLVLAEPVLTQYGLEDTMLDLIFNMAGAAIIAVGGGARLSGVVDAIAARLGTRERETG